MRWLLYIASLVAIALPAPRAYAATFTNCEVIEIVVSEGQNAHVRLSCVPTGAPACAANVPYVAFDKTTTDGKQWLATFMYAHAVGGKVTGTTYDRCPTFQTNVSLLYQVRVTR